MTSLNATSVLVLSAFPGDDIAGCSGAVSAQVTFGIPIQTIVVSDWANRSDDSVEEGRANGLRAECQAAARIVGYPDPVFWGWERYELRYGERLVRDILGAIRGTKADLVYAPSPHEGDAARRALGVSAAEAVRRGARDLRLAWYEVDAPLAPGILLDISDQFIKKSHALECFRAVTNREDVELPIILLNRYRAASSASATTAAEAYVLNTAEALTENFSNLFPFGERQRIPLDACPASPEQRLVSVIIRSMDRETLKDALRSVAIQTYSRIEAVVVNATGGMHSDLGQWCGRFPLRLVGAGRPLRRSEAANVGIDSAEGRCLIFLDDDDLFEPGHIASLVDTLEEANDCLAAYAGVRVEGRAGSTLGIYHEQFSKARLMGGNYLPIHAVLFDRRLVAKGCRFDADFENYEDWDFWLQVACHTDFKRSSEVSAVYRAELGKSGMALPNGEPHQHQARLSVWAKWWPRWRVEDFDRLMESHREQLAAVQQELLSAQQERASAQQELLSVQQERASAQQDLLSARQENASLHQQLASMLPEVTEAIKLVDRLHRQLADRRQQLDARNYEAAQFAQQLKSLREHLDSAKREVLERDSTVASLNGELSAARIELEALNHLVMHRGEQIDALTQELHSSGYLVADRDVEIMQLRQSVEEIHHSTSWRVTRPVRVLKRTTNSLRRATKVVTSAGRNGLRYVRSRSILSLVGRTFAILGTEGARGIRTRIRSLDEIYSQIDARSLQVKCPIRLARTELAPLRSIEIERYEFFFLDVFDTAIIRLFQNPTDLFSFIGVGVNDPAFAKRRVQQEEMARKRNRRRKDITICDIYRDLTGAAMEDEKSAERKFCVANPEIHSLYLKLVAAEKKIYFVSDMYLDKDTVARILMSNGFSNYEDIFISSEDNLIKGDGSRFDWLKRELPACVDGAIHIGDNEIADFIQPRAHGFEAFHYTGSDAWFRSDPFIYSKLDALNSEESLGISFLIGAFRNWKSGFLGAPPNYWRQFGFFFGGALVSAFCSFVSKQIAAKGLGCTKIFFLARDGDIMSQVYRTLYDDLEAIYLLASRRCMSFPSFRSLTDPRDREMLSLFTTPIGVAHAKDVMERFHYNDLGSLERDLGRLGQDVTRWTDADISACMIKNRETIMEKVLRERRLLLDYLSETGFFENHDVVVADVGWSGTIQNGLTTLLEFAGCSQHRIHGFYFGVNAGVLHEHHKTGFLFNGDRSEYANYLNLIELLTSSPHDSVIRIGHSEQGYFPVTRETNVHEKRRQEAAAEIQEGIVDFAKLVKRQEIEVLELFRPDDFRILFSSLHGGASEEDVRHLGELRHAMTLGNNFNQQVLGNC